ncbi:MAG: hypothetical protein HQL14_05185 [Candidatus Omnitrophica bacterium]|nr:hypothetical protein [Candidatus Omnitrophota bacterium]
MSNPIKLTDFKRVITFLVICCFFITSLNIPLIQAQPASLAGGDINLPAPGVRVNLSPEFNPLILKGIKVYPNNPFRFDFILDKGDLALTQGQNPIALKNETTKLVKYFLASLTIPEKDLWVNLSPYENDRIIPTSFGLTQMGRDVLAEDYMLKQITASLVFPEDKVGKRFWRRVYDEASKKYGTTNIPVNTFNKVWIVPQTAVVYENPKAGTAYVKESKLKVMLEQDYLSLKKSQTPINEGLQLKATQVNSQSTNDVNALGSQIIREVVIPELNKEVNEGKNFSQLRQVYNSLILATWYKKKIKDSILGQVYADQNKVAGVNIDDPLEKEKIYQLYLKAFKKGVYNYIKEEQDPLTQEVIPRKYFSGGVNFDAAMFGDTALGTKGLIKMTEVPPQGSSSLIVATENTLPVGVKPLEGDTGPANPDNYQRFEKWFKSISIERLKNKITEVSDRNSLKTFVDALGNKNSAVRLENAENIKNFIATGRVSKEEVKITDQILDILVHGLSDVNSNPVRRDNTQALNSLITAGVVSGEDIRKYEMLKKYVSGLMHENRAISHANADGLNSLMIKGFATKAEIIKELQDRQVSEVLVRGIGGTSSEVSLANVQSLNYLIAAGLVNEEDVKEHNVLGAFVRGLTRRDENSPVSKACVEGLNGLVDAGFATQEDVRIALNDAKVPVVFDRSRGAKSKRARSSQVIVSNQGIVRNFTPKEDKLLDEEIQTVFREVYGKQLPGVGLDYFLKFFALLKDNPERAYEVPNWSVGQLEELFRIFDLFARGLASDHSYQTQKESENSLEKDLIKDSLNLLHTPDVFLSRLKQRFTTMITSHSVTLAIKIHEIAAVNAAWGLIRALGLNKDRVVILYDKEIDLVKARKFFPNFRIQAFEEYSEKGAISVEFHDLGDIVMESPKNPLSVSLPYTPFKFNLPVRASQEDVQGIRESLGITPDRKVIVLGSPEEREEFPAFMKVYNSLYGKIQTQEVMRRTRPEERPLLIIGFRQKRDAKTLKNDLPILSNLSGQSIVVRSDDNMPWSDSKVEGSNVLILNTDGELLKMYGLGNVAVIGSDRNIFEPASQQTPVLYFEGDWKFNQEVKDALVQIGAAQVFSRKILERLMNAPDERAEMVKKGAMAVEKYRRNVRVKAEEFAIQIVGSRPELREKFIKGNAEAEKNKVNTGGIDLTSAYMKLQTQDFGEKFKFRTDSSMLKELQHATGFMPVIVNIQPMTDLHGFLGIQDQ